MIYKYFLKRFFLIFPTLFFIIFLNFIVIQIAPGGPVEKFLSQINHQKITSEASDNSFNNAKFQDQTTEIISSKYLGSNGVDPDLIKIIEKNYKK